MLFYCMLSYLVLHLSVYFESRMLQNYLKPYAQNAGNRVSEVLDFKIFRGTCLRTPWKIVPAAWQAQFATIRFWARSAPEYQGLRAAHIAGTPVSREINYKHDERNHAFFPKIDSLHMFCSAFSGWTHSMIELIHDWILSSPLVLDPTLSPEDSILSSEELENKSWSISAIFRTRKLETQLITLTQAFLLHNKWRHIP